MLARTRTDNRAARRVKAHAMLLAAHTAQAGYVRALKGVLRGVHAAFMDELEPHLVDVAGEVRQDAHTAWGRKLQELHRRVLEGKALGEATGKAFDVMQKKVNKANFDAAKVLLRATPSQTRVAEQISVFRAQNVALIKSAAGRYADQIREVLEDPENFGRGVDSLRKELQERGKVSESQAELIARDQTLKLNGQLNMIRQTNAGVSRYTWSTSHDERVRPDHAELDGEEFDWSFPPETNKDGDRNHPGQDFQCRCVALPVIDLGEEVDIDESSGGSE